MTDRSTLRKQIESSWNSTIVDTYPKRLINSERGLQVFFCHELLKRLEATNRRLFIEPSFTDAHDRKQRTPDVLVCNSRQVIAVIELKYLPRVVAIWKKDMQTLDWFASRSTAIELSNNRYSGPTTGKLKSYTLADDAVLCWAGLYLGPQVDIPSSNIGPRFLGLHAITSIDEAPVIHRQRVAA